MGRPDYREALRASGVITLLAPFDPHVAGTPPLELDLPGSDIDILCHAPDPQAFAAHLWAHLAERDGFTLRQWTGELRAVIAAFHAYDWDFEIFGCAEPVAAQPGWRHFVVERRLLALGGHAVRDAVTSLRRQGLKTEPAFAAAMGLHGDPYAALLALETLSDSALRQLQIRSLNLDPG